MAGASPQEHTGKGGKKALDAELNLVPFIDLLSCCISFLLITAVWTQIAGLQVASSGGPPEPQQNQEATIDLKLLLTEKGYSITMPGAQVDIPKIASANGEVLYMSKDIKLPDAFHGAQLERAPVISVSNDAVTFDGRQVANTSDLTKGDLLNVPALEDALRDERRRFEQIHQNEPDRPFRGLVNVQADRRIPFRVIKRVMFACNQSGFGNINFAALAKGSAPRDKKVAMK